VNRIALTTDYNIIARVEGRFNFPFHPHPAELMWMLGGSGGQVRVFLPEEGTPQVMDLPSLLDRLSPDEGRSITERFKELHFTSEQMAQVLFFRQGTSSKTQWFTIQKPFKDAA
jgi:hypothetical protein